MVALKYIPRNLRPSKRRTVRRNRGRDVMDGGHRRGPEEGGPNFDPELGQPASKNHREIPDSSGGIETGIGALS